MRFSILFGLIFLAAPLQAQSEGDVIFESLSWRDNQFMEQQRGIIDELARANYGRRVRVDKSDIALLQRIIDDQLIPRSDKRSLQAMGIIMGDLYVRELDLQWRIYKDKVGRSRAVCIPKTDQCIFPVTMLSRRIEAGARPQVKRVYEKGESAVKGILPHKPYTKLVD